jgi:hypothetical protein
MAETKTEKCAHPACQCRAAADSDYCGAYCEVAATMASVVCECGHPACVIPAG